MNTIITSFVAERFGVKELNNCKSTYMMNCRVQMIQELPNEAVQGSSWGAERELPLELTPLTSHSSCWGKSAVALLIPPRKRWISSCTTLSDLDRQKELGLQTALLGVLGPLVEFNISEPTWKEVQEVVIAARASSTPGPSQVPHKVYKCCPGLFRTLWKMLRVISRRGTVAEQWRQAEGTWIPKEENSAKLEQLWTISLSVEAKIFFSILARRITDFLLKNTYIDTSVQKAAF